MFKIPEQNDHNTLQPNIPFSFQSKFSEVFSLSEVSLNPWHTFHADNRAKESLLSPQQTFPFWKWRQLSVCVSI